MIDEIRGRAGGSGEPACTSARGRASSPSRSRIRSAARSASVRTHDAARRAALHRAATSCPRTWCSRSSAASRADALAPRPRSRVPEARRAGADAPAAAPRRAAHGHAAPAPPGSRADVPRAAHRRRRPSRASVLALSLAIEIVGADPDARLFQEVRERLGLGYDVGAALEHGRDWAVGDPLRERGPRARDAAARHRRAHVPRSGRAASPPTSSTARGRRSATASRASPTRAWTARSRTPSRAAEQPSDARHDGAASSTASRVADVERGVARALDAPTLTAVLGGLMRLCVARSCIVAGAAARSPRASPPAAARPVRSDRARATSTSSCRTPELRRSSRGRRSTSSAWWPFRDGQRVADPVPGRRAQGRQIAMLDGAEPSTDDEARRPRSRRRARLPAVRRRRRARRPRCWPRASRVSSPWREIAARRSDRRRATASPTSSSPTTPPATPDALRRLRARRRPRRRPRRTARHGARAARPTSPSR